MQLEMRGTCTRTEELKVKKCIYRSVTNRITSRMSPPKRYPFIRWSRKIISNIIPMVQTTQLQLTSYTENNTRNATEISITSYYGKHKEEEVNYSENLQYLRILFHFTKNQCCLQKCIWLTKQLWTGKVPR